MLIFTLPEDTQNNFPDPSYNVSSEKLSHRRNESKYRDVAPLMLKSASK